jgi:hypothetical protein
VCILLDSSKIRFYALLSASLARIARWLGPLSNGLFALRETLHLPSLSVVSSRTTVAQVRLCSLTILHIGVGCVCARRPVPAASNDGGRRNSTHARSHRQKKTGSGATVDPEGRAFSLYTESSESSWVGFHSNRSGSPFAFPSTFRVRLGDWQRMCHRRCAVYDMPSPNLLHPRLCVVFPNSNVS